MTNKQLKLIPDTPNPAEAERAAERALYLEKLAEYLKDPSFREQAGFPLGSDEAILALSDPPYYTACPNPFLAELIAQWQASRPPTADHRPPTADHRPPTPSSEEQRTKDKGLRTNDYHREPFAADVSEGKNNPIYNAHSYHTKVPHKAIMRYILHYTMPGDIVFDGFCGTGMTGVAAQLCGDKKTVQSLGYQVKADGTILDANGQPFSRLGPRKAILNDLSPAATFIAYNYNTPVDITAFEREATRILAEVEAECGWMYETLHTDGVTKGRINYTVWSDVFRCPQCGEEMVFWDVAVDTQQSRVRTSWPCTKCDTLLAKNPKKKSGAVKIERAWETIYHHALNKTLTQAKQVPVLINYSIGKKGYQKQLDDNDFGVIERITDTQIPYWFPVDRMLDGDESRRNDRIGITHIYQFYTHRNLWILASLWNKTENKVFKWLLSSIMPRANKQHQIAISRIGDNKKSVGGKTAGHRRGTLYIPSNQVEFSVFRLIKMRLKVFKHLNKINKKSSDVSIATQSSSEFDIPPNSIDYLFTDPPFGANIMYSELNFLWEAWLQVFNNNKSEAIINRTQKKDLLDYQQLMQKCFDRFYYILKPNHWITVEFHNSKNNVWNAIQESLLQAGFVVADVRTLDKQKKTHTQVTALGSVKQDLVISAYKPDIDFENTFTQQAGTVAGAWAFVGQHLQKLPVIVKQGNHLEVIAERQNYLLYDRMIAFHIQRGSTIPLSAAEFYTGLKQRFPERDGMYFLTEQVAQYDQERLKSKALQQLTLFVSDEKSALQWLQQQLSPQLGAGPQTYQDIQPKFLKELHQARHEKLPELRQLLEENFLQNQAEEWYIPNPEDQQDLERLRDKALWREFQNYLNSKGKLRNFRTEAIRAGFKKAWSERDYSLIISIAARLPQAILQQDPALLMYYDNARLRAEKEPKQASFL